MARPSVLSAGLHRSPARGAVVRRNRGLRATPGRAVREWRARADRRFQGVVEPVRRARGPPDAGTSVHRTTGPSGSRRSRTQLRPVGDAIWSRPIDHWRHDRTRSQASGPLQRPLLLLLGAVGLVLLVTCANVANLVLSRAAARRRELALRAALGSSRARLLQLLLAEGAILSIAGGTIGILLSQALVAAVPAAVASTLPTARDISVDVRVLAFTGAISILTSILFAVIPLLGLDRRGPGSTLQEEASRSTPGVRRHRMQSGLVVSTVTLGVRAADGGRTVSAKLLGLDGDRWRLQSRPRADGLHHAAARRLPDCPRRARVSRVAVPACVVAGWRWFRSPDHRSSARAI